MGAQMRIGFYETVPGYAVKDLVFYFIGAPSGSKEVGVGAAFPTSGKYTVNYDDATNAAKVTFAGDGNALAFSNTFGKLDYTSAFTQEGVTDKPYLTQPPTARAPTPSTAHPASQLPTSPSSPTRRIRSRCRSVWTTP